MSTIISTIQYKLLQALSDCTETTRADLQAKSGVPHGTYDIHMTDLKERELVFVKGGCRVPSLISITMAGQRALAAHINYHNAGASSNRVPPAQINIFALPVYTPPAGGYVRNQGHGHIKSRGISA